MAEVPVIQVLEKEHYFTQYLISLPHELPYPPLGPSSLRLQTKVMCLTSNNLTYAKLGFMLNWWDVHPLPPSTPAPYNDASKYGRMNCWGFAEVLESTHPSVSKGSYLWGYHPIGTLAQDLEVKDAEVRDQVLVTNAYRQHLMPIYNRYLVYPGSYRSEIEAKTDDPAYDSIVRVMYTTAYLMNRFVFSSDPAETLHPGMDPNSPWSKEWADLTGATIICLAPGSKTGLCFAHELRHGRTGARVKRVVAAASESSKDFVEGTGIYDKVVSTTKSPTDLLSDLQIGAHEKVVLVDFGGRAAIGPKWASAIDQAHDNFLLVNVGSEVAEVSQGAVLQAFTSKSEVDAVQVNASDMQARAMEKMGEQKYFDDLQMAWDTFKKEGIKGLKIVWGDGMEDVERGWDKLCKGKAKSNEGYSYLL